MTLFQSGIARAVVAAGLALATTAGGAQPRDHKAGAPIVILDLVPGVTTPTVVVKTDRGQLTMLVDTGSEVTSLEKSGPLLVIFPGGGKVGLYAFAQKDVRSSFASAKHLHEGKLDGVLGQTFFHNFRQVIVDYDRRKLILMR